MAIYPKPRKRYGKFIRLTSVLCLCHPLVCFIYYTLGIILLFMFNHPLFILTIFLLVIIQASYLMRFTVVIKHIKIYLLFCLIIALLNPLFNRRGITILFYMFNKPVTLESLAYGIYMSMVIIGMFVIFLCINKVLGMNKTLYLFSKAVPQTAFMVSMTLRFSELFKIKAKDYIDVQNIRYTPKQNNKYEKIKHGGSLLSGFCLGALEDGMNIAETLRAKEYAKHKRVSYSQFSIKSLDVLFLFLIILIVLPVLLGKLNFIGNIDYYRNFSIYIYITQSYIVYAFIIIFFLLPLILDGFYYLKRKCLSWS